MDRPPSPFHAGSAGFSLPGRPPIGGRIPAVARVLRSLRSRPVDRNAFVVACAPSLTH